MGKHIEVDDDNYEKLEKIRDRFELKSLDSAIALILVWAGER